MMGKGVFLTRIEARARLGRIEVGGEENSKWMGRQMKKSVGHLPTKSGTVRRNLSRDLKFLIGI